jgi:hypothetical protein
MITCGCFFGKRSLLGTFCRRKVGMSPTIALYVRSMTRLFNIFFYGVLILCKFGRVGDPCKVERCMGGPSLKNCLKAWCENINVNNFKVLHVIITWGIWLIKIASFFEDKVIPTIQCASRGLNISRCFRQTKNVKTPRILLRKKPTNLENGHISMVLLKKTHRLVGLVGHYI